MDPTPRRLQRFYRRGQEPPAENPLPLAPEHERPRNSNNPAGPPRSKAEEQLLDEMSSSVFDQTDNEDPLEKIASTCHDIALREVHEFFSSQKRMPSREDMPGLTEKIAAELAKKYPVPENARASAENESRPARSRHRPHRPNASEKTAPSATGPPVGQAPVPEKPVAVEEWQNLFSDASPVENKNDEIKPLDDASIGNEDPENEDTLLSLEDETEESPKKKKKPV